MTEPMPEPTDHLSATPADPSQWRILWAAGDITVDDLVDLAAEIAKLRGLLREAVDGWERQVITGDDGFHARDRIRREAGLT